MANIYVDDENDNIYVSPTEFLDGCSKSEKEELVQLLIKKGYSRVRMSTNETEFENGLDKLRGTYSHLTKEETKTIIGIADKCIE